MDSLERQHTFKSARALHREARRIERERQAAIARAVLIGSRADDPQRHIDALLDED